MKGLLDDDNWVTMLKVINVWTSLRLSYVFCAGVSKDEFKLVFYAVRYLPDSLWRRMYHSIDWSVRIPVILPPDLC